MPKPRNASLQMIIDPYSPFVGEHCETTAIGNLLKHAGLELSEPMLFGLSSGLGFMYWNMKTMPLPFLGGRVKSLTENLQKNLNLAFTEHETASSKKAWEQVAAAIQSGGPVGLQLDCYHLDYFTNKIHFAGHHVAMYGYDGEFAYLVDTRPQGGVVKTSLESLALARNERGPMSARNRSYTVSVKAEDVDLRAAIPRAIRSNALEFLNPPIRNLGYKGILKTSVEVKKWLGTSRNPRADFNLTAVLMERAGTGGALFRNLYRDFLEEAGALMGLDVLHDAHVQFAGIAKKWNRVSELFASVRSADDVEVIEEASRILEAISEDEKKTMAVLQNFFS